MSLLAFISTGWVIFFVIVALVLVASHVIPPLLSRRDYSNLSAELGLTFDPKAVVFGKIVSQELPAVHGRKLRRNLIHGRVDGVETVFVEMGWPGQDAEAAGTPLLEALMCFRQPGRRLPVFQLIKHKGKGARIMEQFGVWRPEHYYIVEPPGNPGFAEVFLLLALKGEERGAVEELFPQSVQDFMLENRKSFAEVQGAGEWAGIIALRTVDGFVGVEHFRSVLALARQVHELFARAAG